MKETKGKGKYEGKGFLFLAGVLLLVAIGIVVGRLLFPAVILDYYTLGVEAKQNSKYGEAYYYLNKAIETDPPFADAYTALAEILTVKGRAIEAIPLLERGLDVVSTPSALRKSLMPLYLSDKEYSKQQENLLALLADTSDSREKAEYTYSLGIAYLRALKLSEARDSFKQVIDKYSGTEWYYRAGLELSLFSIEEETTRNAMLAIAKDPLSPVIAEATKIEDKLAKAQQAEERSDEGQMWGWYGVLMLEQDRCELSEDYFLNGIEEGDKFGIHAGIHGYYGECLRRLGRNSEALTQVDTALSADPLLMSAWETKAATCNVLENTTCADEAYAKLTTVDPTNTDYLNDYSSYLLQHDRDAEALVVIEKTFQYTEEANKATLADSILSLMFLLQTGYDRAPQYIAALDSASSAYYDYSGWLMYITEGSGQTELSTALELDPFNASACYHYAEMLFTEGGRAQALEYAYKAIDYDFSGKIGEKANQLIEKIENRA